MLRAHWLSSLLFLACTIGFTNNSARADLVVNGSFETPIAYPPGYSNPPLTTPGPPDLPGWTVAPGTNVETISTYWAAYDGDQSLDLDGLTSAGTISQILTTLPGQTYAFSFAYANNYAGSNPSPNSQPGALVSLFDGTNYLLNQQIFHSSSSGSSFAQMDWTLFPTFYFVATTAQTLLTFASTDYPTSPGGIALDAVHVNAVPEAGSMAAWSLLGLCFAGWSWRRKE